MLEPSRKAKLDVLRKEQARIAKMNTVSISVIEKVKTFTDKLLPAIVKSKKPDKFYKQIEKYMVQQYGDLYLQYKDEILNSLNQSGIEQRHLIELTLSEPVKWATPVVAYKTLPTSERFKITNMMLQKSAIAKRTEILAKRVTTIVAKGYDSGHSIKEIQAKLDIELGFRDKSGVLNEKGIDLIKQGKFSHMNGHIYENYRIARTETMRMANIQTYDTFDAVDRNNKRLKLISILDARTRQQSAQMNGQISNAEGMFKYPDGNFYKLGQAPARWSINDRETSVIIFQ